MEDLDPPREVPGSARDILETLAAFGMESDVPVLFQSRREAAYAAAFDRLKAAGAVFACWCSRADLASTGGIHRGACIARPDTSRAPAWRLRVPDKIVRFDDAAFGPQSQNLREAAGDFVIRRVEGWYAYQLAVVVDDAEQGITEVVRGADLLDSTPRQIHLQQLLGLPAPTYLHLPLALDAEGRKLSKQDRARPVDRTDPMAALRAALTFLGQRVPDASTPEKILHAAATAFDLAALRARSLRTTCTIPDNPAHNEGDRT
jgi:glutamyl-Q tRNA(Asp) synthetase